MVGCIDNRVVAVFVESKSECMRERERERERACSYV